MALLLNRDSTRAWRGEIVTDFQAIKGGAGFAKNLNATAVRDEKGVFGNGTVGLNLLHELIREVTVSSCDLEAAQNGVRGNGVAEITTWFTTAGWDFAEVRESAGFAALNVTLPTDSTVIPSCARLNQISACLFALGRYSPSCTFTIFFAERATASIADWMLSPGKT
jgi:hypothetical protein